MFAVRHNENARQTICLPCANIKTHGKLFFAGRFLLPCAVENAHGKAPLCRAPENMRTAKIETHGNHRFSRGEVLGSRVCVFNFVRICVISCLPVCAVARD
jgi:hypothetical protein